MFELHPTLAADTRVVGGLSLSLLLMMDDATWPWVILVPQRASIREIHELSVADRAILIDEVAKVSEAMAMLFAPDKLNVAALGNVVSQLHVHVVARFRDDPAWPAPVWGRCRRSVTSRMLPPH
ncbi:MAG: HIT domain-containing protein [Defluviicoccus sp.]|nr:MAG: HIT domain-containing protein [Defluviicoccus sp.]